LKSGVTMANRYEPEVNRTYAELVTLTRFGGQVNYAV